MQTSQRLSELTTRSYAAAFFMALGFLAMPFYDGAYGEPLEAAEAAVAVQAQPAPATPDATATVEPAVRRLDDAPRVTLVADRGQAPGRTEVAPAAGQADSSGGAKSNGKAPGGLSADEVAKRIQKFYGETKDYQARFQQTYTDVAAGSAKKSHGMVYFKKPGKMRWDYYESGSWKPSDRKKLLVSDGDVFWIYEYEFKQVFKQCLASSQLPTSLKFLMGQGNLLEEFDVAFTKASSAQKPVLELTPKEPTAKYAKLRFELDPKTFQVAKTTVYDPYGNTNEIVFEKATINKNLPDSGFTFSPPKGARLLNPNKSCPSP